MNTLTQSSLWAGLEKEAQTMQSTTLCELFSQNPERFSQCHMQAAGLTFDYSKQHITPKILDLLLALARERGVAEQIEQLFAGGMVNGTEQRAAHHVALRAPDRMGCAEAQHTFARFADFVEQVHSGDVCGSDGALITDVINIGIGGSDLGPLLVCDALAGVNESRVNVHFVSYLDAKRLQQLLATLNPATTLAIIASKSFTTTETLSNAMLVKSWLADVKQCVAITSKPQSAEQFGIPTQQIFPMWDWVGGRYSVWSAVGLSIALKFGMQTFNEFLDGAHELDQHFQTAEFSDNMPIIHGMLSIWQQNFLGSQTQAVVPYSHALARFPDYLQQMQMESLGKRVTQHGEPVAVDTGAIVWGGVGTNSQHSFHQLLMQGTQPICVDFILPLQPGDEQDPIYQQLIANCFGQAQTLLSGYCAADIEHDLTQKNYSQDDIKRLTPHKIIPGNNASTMLLMRELSARTLGALIALYEHKVFVQSVIWGINAFDQWGVERGKQLAQVITQDITNKALTSNYDSSTEGLLQMAFTFLEDPLKVS